MIGLAGERTGDLAGEKGDQAGDGSPECVPDACWDSDGLGGVDLPIPKGFRSGNYLKLYEKLIDEHGDELVIRAAVKPIPSITKQQKTIDKSNNPATISTKGRHDISAIPRINVVCEAMVNIVLSDHVLRQRAIS